MRKYMPKTRNGHNLFDMLSMLQKGVRRGLVDIAGYAAAECSISYRTALWNRIITISAEDCWGILTKELINLRSRDEAEGGLSGTKYLAKAIRLLCDSQKSRDACYFACNFILAQPERESIAVSDSELSYYSDLLNNGHDLFFLMEHSEESETPSPAKYAVILDKAICSLDMENIGYAIQGLRDKHRKFLWKVIQRISREQYGEVLDDEILSLMISDDIVNHRKPIEKKDEIYFSKAVILLCYIRSCKYEHLRSVDYLGEHENVDWGNIKVEPIHTLSLPEGGIPDYVFDCHTIRGKMLGRNDWDMTVDEEAALSPRMNGFFENGSWYNFYSTWYKKGNASKDEYEGCMGYSKTHLANPVEKLS